MEICKFRASACTGVKKASPLCGLEAWKYIEYHVSMMHANTDFQSAFFMAAFIFLCGQIVVEIGWAVRYNKRCSRKSYYRSEIENLVNKLPVQALLHPIISLVGVSDIYE